MFGARFDKRLLFLVGQLKLSPAGTGIWGKEQNVRAEAWRIQASRIGDDGC